MTEMIWRLLTAMFLILMCLAVLAVDWILGNGGFDTMLGSLVMFACLLGIAAGIFEGLLTIWKWRQEMKQKAE